MEALDEPQGEEGIVERVRSNPRLLIAIATGAILILAWIGWAIHVTSSNGATAGLGVVIAWPALLAALALVSLPFIGLYLLIRRLATDSGTTAAAEPEAAEAEMEDDDSDEESGDSAENEPEDDDSEDAEEQGEEDEEPDEESDDDSESDAEAKAAKS